MQVVGRERDGLERLDPFIQITAPAA